MQLKEPEDPFELTISEIAMNKRRIYTTRLLVSHNKIKTKTNKEKDVKVVNDWKHIDSYIVKLDTTSARGTK
jgi:hypothetical protein